MIFASTGEPRNRVEKQGGVRYFDWKWFARTCINRRIDIVVHQEGLRVNEKILRHFDLSSQYGVSHLSFFFSSFSFTLSSLPEACDLLIICQALHWHHTNKTLETGERIGSQATRRSSSRADERGGKIEPQSPNRIH